MKMPAFRAALLLFFAFPLFSVSALASAAAPTREELRQTVAHIAQLARDAETENVALKSDLAATRFALNNQQQRADTLRTWGIDQQNRAEQAEAQVAKDQITIREKDAAITARDAHIHQLKWMVCAALALAAVFVAFSILPATSKIYALAAAPITFAAAWIYF